MLHKIGLATFVMVLNMANAAEIDSRGCFSDGWTKSRWQQLALVEFDVKRANPQTQKSADQLAAQLRFCLADPDPVIRDEIAYMGFTRWLRNDQLGAEVRLSLFDTLLADLNSQTNDAKNVYLPFAALVLSEVVRVDRITPYLNSEQRQKVLSTVRQYLASNTDLRGFSDTEGWRHAVAHSADVFLQLVLNPALSPEQTIEVSQIVAQHINPANTHFYHFDEPHRLMRPIVYAMLRDDFEQKYWLQWITEIASPAPQQNWGNAFKSESGLAKRHNTKAFLHALYVTAVSSGNDKLSAYKSSIEQALAAL